MDFATRTPNQSPVGMPRPASPPESVGMRPSGMHNRPTGNKRDNMLGLWGRIGTNVLLFLVALMIAAVAWLTYSATPASQNKYVDGSKLQAVFLNTGQVYFGHVTSFNKDYLVLNSVYYLQSDSSSSSSSSSSSNQNVSLVKLGCELHKPYDQMVINTTEVTFWENLQSDGQVAKAVAQFQKDNPNGQTCSNTGS